MEMKLSIKYLPLKLAESMLAFLLVIGCASIYVHTAGVSKLVINLFIILVVILLSAMSFYLLSIEHHLTGKIIGIWISYFILFLVPFSILNNFNYPMGSFFILQFSVLSGLIFYFQLSRQQGNPWSLIIKIDKIVLIVAMMSIIFWLLFSILKIVTPTGFVFTDWGPSRPIPSFYGMYFETQPISFYGISIIRNTAFYTEGPMYAFVLSISLISRLFLLNKSIKNSFPIIIAMFTTLTSTAIVVIIMAIFFKYFNKSKNRTVNTFKNFFFPFFSIVLLSSVIFTLEQKTRGGESFGVRMDDIHSAILAWFRHPFIGNGIGNFQSLISNMDSIRIQLKSTNEIGFSSGLFQIIALGGIMLTTIYVYPMIAFTVSQYKKIGISAIAFPLILLTIFTSSIISYEWLFMVIIVMLYVNSLKL